MPTLIVENVPPEVYERLQQRAAARQRTLPQELLHLLQQALREENTRTPRLPDFVPGEEVAAPCDLPRSSQPVPVVASSGQPRLPDHLPDEEPG
jgi:plasmid stability protein